MGGNQAVAHSQNLLDGELSGNNLSIGNENPVGIPHGNINGNALNPGMLNANMNANGVLNASNGQGLGFPNQSGANQLLNANTGNLNADSALMAAKQMQNGENPAALLQGNMNGQSNPLGNGQANGMMNGQVNSLMNGQANGVMNGQASGLVNGQASGMINGQVNNLTNGQVNNLYKWASERVPEQYAGQRSKSKLHQPREWQSDIIKRGLLL